MIFGEVEDDAQIVYGTTNSDDGGPISVGPGMSADSVSTDWEVGSMPTTTIEFVATSDIRAGQTVRVVYNNGRAEIAVVEGIGDDSEEHRMRRF